MIRRLLSTLTLCCAFVIVNANELSLIDTSNLSKSFSEQALSDAPSVNVFGANLFHDNNTNDGNNGLNPYYVIQIGDRIALNLWGAINANEVLIVDANGNIFLPSVGPIKVAGLTAKDLESHVKDELNKTYNRNVFAYVTVLSATPITVYVSGFVDKPGQYSGMQTDSVVQFLKRAGGVDSKRGSYREIYVQRNNSAPIRIDLYPFLLDGEIPNLTLQDNDVIVVKSRQSVIDIRGLAQNSYLFEISESSTLGSNILGLSRPYPSTSHVAVSGIRAEEPFFRYMMLSEFKNITIFNGDKIDFKSDIRSNVLDIEVLGEHLGPSFYSVPKSTKLVELLNHIPVDPLSSNIEAIYLKRRSVAETQKKILDMSLNRLSQSVLTAPARSDGEASIRLQEAQLVNQFIKEARNVRPEGIVVVSKDNIVSDIFLEQGDKIIIPKKSDIVNIGGEVYLPQAIVFSSKYSLDTYIQVAGGYTERADKKNILYIFPNGEIKSAKNSRIEPGVKILVMPEVEAKYMQSTKDITQILYQLALAAGTVIRVF